MDQRHQSKLYPGQSIAYLVSQYPAVSHTFILSEILQLRSKGFTIYVASINSPDRKEEKLTQQELEEKHKTFYVKQAGVWRALEALGKLCIFHPAYFLKGLYQCFFLAKGDLRRTFKNFFYLGEAALMNQWMDGLNLRHLHVHFANPASTVALILSKISPCTFSISVHGPDEFYDVTLNYLREKIEGAQFIRCIGTYAKSQLMKISSVSAWGKFSVAPLGVDPNRFLPVLTRESPIPFKVLCIGRLVPSKGQHILIQAIDLLIKRGYAISLNIVGDGPDRRNLEALVSERGIEPFVTFSGALNQNEVLQAYKEADIFTLASFAEGVPVVLMEAMSMELPCVSTYVNGIPELIRHDIEGLLVPAADPQQFSEALEKLIQSPELRRRLGKSARERILTKYDLEKNNARLASIFQDQLTRS